MFENFKERKKRMSRGRDRVRGKPEDKGVKKLFSKVIEGRSSEILEHLHGSAEFATFEEMKKAGFRCDPTKNPSVLIGATRVKYENGSERVEYLYHDGPEHVMVYAPTRSGKGVGLIVPTLVTWKDSIIVLDIKKENYEQSAGYRHTELGQKVLKFEPTDPIECSRHNIFAEVRWGTLNEQQDVQNVSLTMVETDEDWDHWHATSQELLIGIMTHLWYMGMNQERQRKIELAYEKTKSSPDPAVLYEKSKPIQGNPGKASDAVATADVVMLKAMIYDHVSAFPAIRGKNMRKDCPICNEEGYSTVVGIPPDEIAHKQISDMLGDRKNEYALKLYRSEDGSVPTTLPFWCKECIDAAHTDPTAHPPVWQTQPGWVIDYKGKGHVRRTHPKVYQNAMSYLTKPPDERGSVKSTLSTRLVLFQDPIIAQNTAYCDWRIRDLMYHDTPVTLYLVFSPNDIKRLSPLIRLMVAMIGRTYTAKMEYKNGRTLETWNHRLLMLLDEFPSIGKIEVMEDLFAYMAGYGITAMTIIQDIKQLYKRYTKDEAITSNHHIQIAYAPNNLDTAKHISESLGKSTITQEKTSESLSKKSFGGGNDSRSISVEQTARDLLTVDEVKRLRRIQALDDGTFHGGDMLIMSAGENPILGERALWFDDPWMTKKVRLSNKWAEKMRSLGSQNDQVTTASVITEEEREAAYIKWMIKYQRMISDDPTVEIITDLMDSKEAEMYLDTALDKDGEMSYEQKLDVLLKEDVEFDRAKSTKGYKNDG